MQTIEELTRLQSQPLERKILMTRQRIREWVNHYGIDGVYVSFSGGKDSTVLLDIARKDYPYIQAVFVDVPTQYPELKTFALTYENVTVLKPKISFYEVCERYGFPIFGKEIANTVHDARKYLTSVRKSRNALTDRQTDRQTDCRVRSFCGCNGNRQARKSQKQSIVSAYQDGEYP